jgi:hypothetical protein
VGIFNEILNRKFDVQQNKIRKIINGSFGYFCSKNKKGTTLLG